MTEHAFDVDRWESLCDACAVRCAQRCMTPIHFVLILGQEIDDLLDQLAGSHVAQATAVARKFGYETVDERRALRSWLHQGRLGADTRLAPVPPMPTTSTAHAIAMTRAGRVGSYVRSFASTL